MTAANCSPLVRRQPSLIAVVVGALLLAAGAGASPRNANDKRSTLQAQLDALVAPAYRGWSCSSTARTGRCGSRAAIRISLGRRRWV